MKQIVTMAMAVLIGLGAISQVSAADDKKTEASDKKAKAYPLDKCVVTDESSATMATRMYLRTRVRR